MDIHIIVKVSPVEAILGVEKTLNLPILGKKNISVHHGSQHGTIITQRGEGIPSISHKDERGNLLFHIEIEVPKKLSSEERKLYESLLDLEGGKK
jgi:molecular chaperone DnaJ